MHAVSKSQLYDYGRGRKSKNFNGIRDNVQSKWFKSPFHQNMFLF